MKAGRKKKALDEPRMDAILVSVAALTRIPKLGLYALVWRSEHHRWVRMREEGKKRERGSSPSCLR